MNQKAKHKLAGLVDERCKSAGGQRAYARKLGVSLIAVQGWIEARSIPNVENLMLIAHEAGFTVDELLSYLGFTNPGKSASIDLVLKQMYGLPREELVKVLEAGVRMLSAVS